MAIKIYGAKNNARTRALLAIAKHENVPVELLGKDAPEYAEKFPQGKIPALIDGDYAVTETIAIAVYLASVNRSATTSASLAETAKNAIGLGPITLLGSTLQERASILQWASFVNMELVENTGKWCKPLVGLAPYNKKEVDTAEEKVKSYLNILEKQLQNNTFLATERITIADILFASALQRGNELLYGKDIRDAHPNIYRHYNTVFHQSWYTEVTGEKEPTFIAETVKYQPPAKPKAEPKPKAEKAEKPKKQEEEDEAPPAPKPKHPLAELPPATSFPLDELKRQYSNLDTPVFLQWFEKNYNPQEYSLWHVEYKYNSELTLVFMSSNLITGLHTRLEASRKFIFGNMLVYGQNRDNAIRGVYLVRGADWKPAFDVAPDHESYNFSPLNWEKPEDRKLVEDVWKWEDTFEGKEYADGKTFK